MRKFITAVLAATTMVAATPAMAWGEREQGALAGVVGTIVLQQISRPPVAVVAPAPVPVGPPMVPYYPGSVYPDYTYRPMYKAVDIFFPDCQCYRTVMVRVN